MNNDTRIEANTRIQKEARRTTGDLLKRSLQGRFAAVAREVVALGLIEAGADQFTHIATGSFSHGFPDGADYGALCPEDDLSKVQAEAIHKKAMQAVQVEAKCMMKSAPPEALVLIAGQLAEWLEGSAAEWVNSCRIYEEMREEEEEARQKEAQQAADKKAQEEAKANLSPGRQYVDSYLREEVDRDADANWLAESIDDGTLLACPRCHFLHLPQLPFPRPPHEIKRNGEAVSSCDVCDHLPALCDPINWAGDWQEGLYHAEDDLKGERAARAITLYQLWIGATNAADALRTAAVAETISGLVALARTPGAEVKGGEGRG